MNRVLHIAPLKGSGIGMLVINLLKTINRNNVMFDFWLEGKENEKEFFEEEAINLGAYVYKYTKQDTLVKDHITRLKSLYKTIKRNEYSVVHIHVSDSISQEYAIVCKLAGVKKIIIHSHSSFISADARNQKLKIRIHNKIKKNWKYLGNYFIAVSKEAGRWMYDSDILYGKQFCILKNGIDLEKYKISNEKRRYWRDKLGIEEETLVLGNVGRLVEEKNPQFMIEVLKEMCALKKNVKLLLIGRDGTQKQKIEQLINKYYLQDNVIFGGESNCVHELLQAMDVFIFPSKFEGLGIVAIEAQVAGLPVFASMGVPEEASAGNNFFRLNLEDGAKKWASDICLFMNNYIRRDGIKEAKECGYDIVDAANWIEKLYLEEDESK